MMDDCERGLNLAPPPYWTIMPNFNANTNPNTSSFGSSSVPTGIELPTIHYQNPNSNVNANVNRNFDHSYVVGEIRQNSSGFTPMQPAGNISPPFGLDSLQDILAHHQRFSFFSGKISCRSRLMTVQIQLQDRDSDCPLFSILTTPDGGICRFEKTDDNAIGATFKVFDSCGKLLITGKGNGQSIAVYCGDEILGVISEIGLCSSTLTVRNILGEIHLRVATAPESILTCFSSSWTCFNIMNENEHVVARMLKTKSRGSAVTDQNRSQVELIFDSSLNSALDLDLNVRTKSLILLAAHLTYVRHFAQTPFGKMGYRRYYFLATFFLLIFCILLILFIFRVFFV